MSRVQKLRVFVVQRLNAALDDILAAFEKTIVTYEQEAALRQEVISRQHALLCAVHKPLMEDPSAGAFTLQLTGIKDPDQTQNSPHVDARSMNVPEEHRGDQLPHLDQAEIIQFTYNPRCAAGPGVNVERFRSEPGPTGPAQDVPLVLSSETEDSDDYGRDRVEPKPASTHFEFKTDKAGPFRCRVCSQTFTAHRRFFRHTKTHLLDPDLVCGVCGERFKSSDSLSLHIRTHQTTTQSRGTRFNPRGSFRIHDNQRPKIFPSLFVLRASLPSKAVRCSPRSCCVCRSTIGSAPPPKTFCCRWRKEPEPQKSRR